MDGWRSPPLEGEQRGNTGAGREQRARFRNGRELQAVENCRVVAKAGINYGQLIESDSLEPIKIVPSNADRANPRIDLRSVEQRSESRGAVEAAGESKGGFLDGSCEIEGKTGGLKTAGLKIPDVRSPHITSDG